MKPTFATLIHFSLIITALLSLGTSVRAQVPNMINYQGRVAVNGTNFNGIGQFKFALVNANGSITYWSNAPLVGGQPSAVVSLDVTNGSYSVLLGDTAIANMAAIPAEVMQLSDVRLRVWFNDGTLGFQQLSPDLRIVTHSAPTPNVPNGIQEFESVGTTNFVVPAGITRLLIEVWGSGGGGGGGGAGPTGGGGGGGGSGGYARAIVPVTPGATYKVVVGARGEPGTNGVQGVTAATAGTAGGDTMFQKADGTILLRCTGGMPGQPGSAGVGGAGGPAGEGDPLAAIRRDGEDGGDGEGGGDRNGGSDGANVNGSVEVDNSGGSGSDGEGERDPGEQPGNGSSGSLLITW